MPGRIRLLGTQGCHLCEVAEAMLLEALRQASVSITPEIIDILDDTTLYERFSTQIPVIQHPDMASVLTWPFGTDDIHHYLNSLPSSGASS